MCTADSGALRLSAALLVDLFTAVPVRTRIVALLARRRREPKDVEVDAAAAGGAEGGAAAAAAGAGRDVFNEKPSLEDVLAAEEQAGSAVVLPRGVTIHTTRVRRGGRTMPPCGCISSRHGVRVAVLCHAGWRHLRARLERERGGPWCTGCGWACAAVRSVECSATCDSECVCV